MPYANPNMAGWLQEIEASARTNLDKLARELQIPKEKCHLLIGQGKTLILETAAQNRRRPHCYRQPWETRNRLVVNGLHSDSSTPGQNAHAGRQSQ